MVTGERAAAPAPPRPPRRGAPGLLRWGAALDVVAATHTAVSLDAVAPVQTKDEIGYLAAARWLATGEGAGLLTPDYAGGYAAGWGLLTAPLWWLTSHPPTVYVASVVLGVLLAVGLVVPATLLARRLGAGPRASLLLAAALGVAGGRLGYTGYALPEGLLTVQLTTTAWLLLRLADSRPGGRPGPPVVPWGAPSAVPSGTRPAVPWGTLAALALLLAWLPTTHARFAPAAALGLLVVASWALVHRSRAGALALVAGAAGAAAGWLLNARVEAELYGGGVARTAVAAEQAGALRPGDVLALAVGHAWYAAAAWTGLTVLGLLALLRPAVRELGARRPGAAVWLVAAAPAQLLVGAAYLSTRLDDGGRVDQLVYGRYGDPLWFVLALAGGAALLSRRSPARLLVAALVVTAVLSAAALVVLRATRDRVEGFVQLNVPGLEAWAWRVDGQYAVPWAPATTLALAVLAGFLLVARATAGTGDGGTGVGTAARTGAVSTAGAAARTAAVGLVGVLLLGTALVAEDRTIAPRDLWIQQMFGARDLVEAHPGVPVLLVEDRPLLLSGNALQWWLADRVTRLVRTGEALPAGTPSGTLVVGPADLPPAAPGTLTLLGVEPSGSYAVWQLDR
ncbi:hypothetical protein ACFQL5_15395 [Aquipuribacter hungaricus]|uniref:hypothetical protein n=1 Tax=Aquipuribacter hungaricus TaxID=545624 RepID=UPI00361A040B